MDVCVNLNFAGGILSQPEHVSNHHVAHFKYLYLTIILFNYISIKLEENENKNKNKKLWPKCIGIFF